MNSNDFVNTNINNVIFNKSNTNEIKMTKPQILGCGLFLYSLGIMGFLLLSFIVTGSTSSHKLIDENFIAIIKIAFFYALFDLIIFVLPFIIVKKISPNSFVIQLNGIGSLIIGTILFIAVLTPANIGWVKLNNVLFDNSEGITHYIKIKDKYEYRKSSGKHSTRKAYGISFDSWKKNNKTINLEVFSSEYKKLNKNQIYTIKSYKGFHNFEYINTSNFKKVNESKFPENIKFPLTKEEAEKAIKSNESQSKENNNTQN